MHMYSNDNNNIRRRACQEEMDVLGRSPFDAGTGPSWPPAPVKCDILQYNNNMTTTNNNDMNNNKKKNNNHI